LNKATWNLAVVGVLVAAVLVSISGAGALLPLDSHEVFVARSAEEMMQRGSYIVPYFNDEPRIKKPPLAYWLVIAVDRINGADGLVTEIEARLPSIISGVLLVALTISLGCVLFNPVVGLCAGLLLTGTGGFVNYTHSARPEVLYAMLCTAGILGFALSHRNASVVSHVSPGPAELERIDNGSQPHSASAPWWAWFGWFMMGLAIIAKGPQLPLLLVCGWIFAMIVSGRGKQSLAILRPWTGALIMGTVSGWWYVALWKTLPHAWDIWEGETLDKYFSAREPLSRYFDPYYFYRTAQLILPWVAPYVLAAATPWLKEFKYNRESRLLWWTILAPMIVLSISLSRREYYMLPATGALAVLMAAATTEVGRTVWKAGRANLWKAAAGLHILILAGAVLALRFMSHDSPLPSDWGVTAVLMCAVAAIIFLIVMPNDVSRPGFSCTATAAALAIGPVLIVAAAARGSLWSSDRISECKFGLQVAAIAPDNMPLIGWQEIWQIEQYYDHRVIPSFENAADLEAAADKFISNMGECYVLVEERDDPRRPALRLHKSFNIEPILVEPSQRGGTQQLWRLTLKSASAQHAE
jgi:4-amino-4-deoxy-L-arabinose transferase-like glycosyltransferase